NIGMATIERCTITGNSSDYSGAGVVNGGTMTMSDCTLSDNMVGEHGDGGAVENDRTLTVTHCDLRRNKATGSNGFAGAIMNFGGTLAVSDSTFEENEAASAGGAIGTDFIGPNTITITRTVFNHNTSGRDGGALWFEGGTLSLVASSFSANAAVENGGAVFDSGDLDISDCTFNGNTAGVHGGALGTSFPHHSPALRIENSTFSGNTAATRGGGLAIHDFFSGITILGTTITGNTLLDSAGAGGGLFSQSQLFFGNSIIAGNSAATAPDVVGAFVASDG